METIVNTIDSSGITIERNIPLPDARRNTGVDYSIKLEFLNYMKVGESFVISRDMQSIHIDSARKHIYSLNADESKKTNGKRFTIRTLSGKSKKPSAVRVWRVR